MKAIPVRQAVIAANALSSADLAGVPAKAKIKLNAQSVFFTIVFSRHLELAGRTHTLS